MYAGLILAAGASTRLGHPKQLVSLNGERLLERSVRIAREGGCAPVAVVLGASEELIRGQCGLAGVLAVSNPDWAEGMGSSLRRGIQALAGEPGVVVMTCDMPGVQPAHVRLLAASGGLTASVYGGRRGVPAYFPKEAFPFLLSIKGDTGARQLLQSASGVELREGTLDIDTPNDLAQAQRIVR